MKKGYIKLYRQIQECWVWEVQTPFDERSAWIDLLMSANHDDHKTMFDGQMIVVKRGQWITSVRKLAERWGWGNQKTLKFLRALEEDKMILRDANSRRTLITIVNYEKFQGYDDEDGTVTERKQNTDRTLTEHCSTTNNNSKNVKNVKNNNPPISPLVDERFTPKMLAAIDEWLTYKSERREGYKETGKRALLTEIHNNTQMYGEDAVIDLIHQSMASGYRGITFARLKQPRGGYVSRIDNRIQAVDSWLEGRGDDGTGIFNTR